MGRGESGHAEGEEAKLFVEKSIHAFKRSARSFYAFTHAIDSIFDYDNREISVNGGAAPDECEGRKSRRERTKRRRVESNSACRMEAIKMRLSDSITSTWNENRMSDRESKKCAIKIVPFVVRGIDPRRSKRTANICSLDSAVLRSHETFVASRFAFRVRSE